MSENGLNASNVVVISDEDNGGQTADETSDGQPKLTCVTDKDGNRLLTLGDYVVTFTNMENNNEDDQTSTGFQTASSLIRTTGQLAPGVAAETRVVETEVEQEQPVIRLDETQERISKLDINRPLLIVAGAGSGKTSTLCARVIEIIRQGIRPQSILVITFTNKASNELKNRIFKYMKASGMLESAGIIDDGSSEEVQKRRAFSHMPSASTFHSWCYGLLMRYYKNLGWSKCPLVAATESEHKKILKLALDQLEDCRRLVQCELMLNISPPVSSENEQDDTDSSIYIPDAEERWGVVLQKAQERSGFSMDAYKRQLHEDGIKGNYRPPNNGKATKFGERAKATAEHFSLMRYLYQHLYVEIGVGLKLVDYIENPIDYGDVFEGKDAIASIMSFIYQAKARGHSPTTYPQLECSILEAYNGTLRRFNLMDFDDLLMFANKLLDDSDILGWVRNEYRYLLLDEFQDFNQLQTDLVLRLQVGVGRVTAVGDERQSIYAFRGAACENNFRLFLERFVDANIEESSSEKPLVNNTETVRGSMQSLTRNYRSHRGIVDLGNIVALDTIGNSKLLERLRVPLHALESIPVVPVRIQSAYVVENEARIIVRGIKRLLDKQDCKGSDIAILLRCLKFGSYRPTGKIEAELLRNGIQYVVRGGYSALKSRRMQMFMALVRIVANPEDDIAFDYCLEALVKNIGPAAIKKIKEFGSFERLCLFDKAERASMDTSLLPRNSRVGLQGFIEDVRRWQMEIETLTLDNIVRAMFKEYIMEVGEDAEMEDAFKGDSDEELDGEETDPVLMMALAIKDSLFQSPDLLPSEMTDGGELNPDSPCSMMLLRAYSSQLCLLSSSAEDKGVVKKPKMTKDAASLRHKNPSYESAVVISTVHQSKGLEWEHVFLPQFNENLFPMGYRGPCKADQARSVADAEFRRVIAQASHQHYREEGRLAYVAITRAKRGLYITVLEKYPMFWMRKMFGDRCIPSQYLPGSMVTGGKSVKRY
ncbi:hypothetical protein H4S08_004612 [Coemansia sp. RSA 1365]|nr:hypothetical protein H4S08_004612 [Coemansia sp. RSA 1365]